MTATQLDSERTISRRGVMKTIAVGIGAAAGIGALGSTAQTAEAIDWGDVGTIAATTVVGGPIGLGWALRETEVLGSDAPAEGLTPDALQQQVYQTAKTRKSNNASTFIDNKNILDGAENSAYTDAKIAAIEQLNDGASESDVLGSADDAIDSYLTTVEKNLLKSWNESVNELYSMISTLESHEDLSVDDSLSNTASADGLGYDTEFRDPSDREVDLLDGSTFDLERINVEALDDPDGNNAPESYSGDPLEPVSKTDRGQEPFLVEVVNPDGDDISYLDVEKWEEIHNEITTVYDDVSSGIETWVTEVYGDVQSGDIEVSELLTPRERAEMLSDEEGEAQAIADLAALNIPVDSEREATITITETDATLSGTLGLSDESDGPIEVGDTYVPDDLSGDVYLTGDVSQISGEWTEYEDGVDGGEITLTAEPYDGVTYEVTTAAGESVSVEPDSWEATDSDTWTYDASDELEETITEVDSIEYASSDDEEQIETLRLTREFTVDSITNRESGEEVTSAEFESSEPQNDENYISQDEWEELENQNEELIEKYEDSQNSGGGAGGGFFPDGGPSTGVIAAVVGGIGIVYALFGQGDN